MVSIDSDCGARLAALLPTSLRLITDSVGAAGAKRARSAVVIAVDGLGWANYRARRGHARALQRLEQRRIETVTPTTTAAALTTLTTGALPGQHGLVGYRIQNPQTRVVHTTLSDWENVGGPGEWQRATPVFHRAVEQGLHTVAIGRPAHKDGGLTAAILSGATYLGGATIADRFQLAQQALRAGPTLAYLYVDELDRAGHQHGWESDAWTARLEQFDEALDEFLRVLPKDVGVVITADHGMVDVPAHRHVLYDSNPALTAGVVAVGGEPRFRALYLGDAESPEAQAEAAHALATAWREAEGERAWVLTRAEAVTAGLFGDVAAEVLPRIGDVLVAPRKGIAYYDSSAEDAVARGMVGQHGSLTDDERGIPLFLGGAFEGAAAFSPSELGVVAATGAHS